MVSLKQEYKTTFAVVAIVFAVLALSFGDAIIKLTGVSLPLWQLFILRSLLALPVLMLLVAKRRESSLHSVLWVTVRCVLLVAMWLCYYSSLPLISLSSAAAVYYTAPVFIAIVTAIVSGRMPLPRVWFALVLGFTGVLLILRPDGSEVSFAMFLPLFAAVLYALAMVLTSVKCRDDDPIMLAIALNVAFVISGGILGMFSGSEGSFMFGPWQALNLKLIGTIAILALVIVVGNVGAAIAYQKGPPVTIAIFDYAYLVFSVIWGMLFFSEFPNFIAIVGIVAIAIAGYLVMKRVPDA